MPSESIKGSVKKGKVLRNLNVKDFLYMDAEADCKVYTGYVNSLDARES